MAVKPDRVQAKQVFAYVNSVPTRRVQSFDWASNFTTDSVFELGNAGIVEDSVTLVETSVTMNANEWATTDLIAQMFGVYEFRNIRGNNTTASVANLPATLFIACRGADGIWTNLATNDWIQVIRLSADATTNAAHFCKVQGVTYVSGSRTMRVRLTTATKLPAAPATGDIVALVNKYRITQDTVDANPVHLVLPHRYSSTATTIMHSILLPRCYVDNVSFRIDTGGAAEQNFSLLGEEEIMLLGSRRECQTITGSLGTYTSGTGALTFTVPKDSRAAFGSPYMVYVGSNQYKHSTTAITHTSGAVTCSLTIDANLAVDASSPIVYYFTNKTKRGYKGLTNITSSIGKVTKGYVDISMKVGAGVNTKLQRVTGFDLTIPLSRESIDELGTSRSIAKPLEGNLRNEITLAFSRNDLKEYAQMVGDESAFSAGTLTEILMSELKQVKNVEIYVKFYSSQTLHDSTTLLSTWTFLNCNYIGSNSATPISGASTLELKFSTQSIDLLGSGNPPVYA